MKKLLVSVILLVSAHAYAQEKVTQFNAKIANDGYNSFYFTDLDYAADGQLTIFGRMSRVGTLFVTKEGKSTGFANGNELIPSVAVITSKGGITNMEREYINLTSLPNSKLKGYQYEALDVATKEKFATSEKDKPLSELLMKYPKAFGQARQETESFFNYSVESSIWSSVVRETETKYLLDPVRNKLIAQQPQKRVIEVKLPPLSDGKYLYESQFLKDNKRKMITLVAQMTKKGESKFYPMKNRKVATLGSTGEIINSFDLQFNFPRAAMFGGPLGMSATDTIASFDDGGIFIFGRVLGGGKNNDPDETNYDFVITGPQGELVTQGAFKFGTPKRDLSPLYAYKKDGKILLLAKGVGNDNPGYAILTFDNTGLIDTKEYPAAQLQSKTTGPYIKGITTNYGRLLQVTNHINLKDGSVLLCGEAFEDDTPVGASFSDPKVRKYFSQIFLFIDGSGNLVRNMVVEKTEPDAMKSYTRQTLLGDVGTKLIFVSQEKAGQLIYPTLTTVDPVGGLTKKIALKMDNVYNIDGDIIYRYFIDRNEILFLGRNTDTDTYTLNSVVYKVN